MSNSNRVLIVVLTFIVVCVVGYALFSDNITVTGTATAQGSFDIVTTCQTGIDSRIGTTTSLGWSKEGGFINDSCTVTGNKVSMTTEFLYPGAQRYFTLVFKNNGTIDAIMDVNKIIETEEICVSDDAKGTNKRCTEGNYLEGLYTNFGSMFMTSSTEKGVIYIDPSGNIITLEEATKNGIFDATNQKVRLKAGYYMYLVYYGIVGFDPRNPNTSNKLYVDTKENVEIIFEQITVNDN